MLSRAGPVLRAITLLVCLAVGAMASPPSSPTTAPSTAPATAPAALPSLIAALEAPASAVERAGGFDRTTARRLVALEKIEALGPAAADSAPSLARALAVPQVGPAAASALRSLGEGARRALSQAADHSDPWVRGTAIQLLCRFGPQSLPFAERGMNDADPRVRVHVVYGLPWLAEAGEPLLVAAMESGEPVVRRAAFSRVSRTASTTLRDARIRAGLTDADPLIRYNAVLRTRPPRKDTFPTPTGDLGADWPVQWLEARAARDFLKRPPADLRPFLGRFTLALGDPDPRARVAALRSHDDLPTELLREAQAALPKLAALASSDPDAEVRDEADGLWRRLFLQPPASLAVSRGPEVFGALWPVLTEPSIRPSFRRASAEFLNKYWNGAAPPPTSDPQAANALPLALLHASRDGVVDADIAAGLLERLAHHQAFTAQALAAQGALFQSLPPAQRVRTAQGLWRRGQPSAPTLLQLALADADPAVRLAAAKAAGATVWDATPVTPAVVALMADRDPSLRAAAADAVRMGYMDVGPIVPALTALLADADPRVRAAAVEALGSPWDRRSRNVGKSQKLVFASQPVVTALVPMLTDPDASVAQAAAANLNRVSPPPGATWVAGPATSVPLPPPAPPLGEPLMASNPVTPAQARPAPRTISFAILVSIALFVGILALALLLWRRGPGRALLGAGSASVVPGTGETASGSEGEDSTGLRATLARLRERRGR